jgi:hypothetical protein
MLIVLGTSFTDKKCPGHEFDHTPLSSAKVKNTWGCTSSQLLNFMIWKLLKHMDKFTLFSLNREDDNL